jgi:hypothetical protein
VVVTTTATVAPVSAAVGTSSGEQSAVEDFKEMVDNFPPNVLAMLVKLPPVSDDCLDALRAEQLSPSRSRWRYQCRRLPRSSGGRSRVLPQTAVQTQSSNHALSVKA